VKEKKRIPLMGVLCKPIMKKGGGLGGRLQKTRKENEKKANG